MIKKSIKNYIHSILTKKYYFNFELNFKYKATIYNVLQALSLCLTYDLFLEISCILHIYKLILKIDNRLFTYF